MYCYKCGTENPEIANFCRNCGTEVKQIEKFFTGELYCYKCGEKNLNEAKFCRACGFNIDSLRKVNKLEENNKDKSKFAENAVTNYFYLHIKDDFSICISNPIPNWANEIREFILNNDDGSAFRLAKKMAEANNSYAMQILGDFYRLGKGIKENKEEAYKWYRKSANLNNAEGLYSISLYGSDNLSTEEIINMRVNAMNMGSVNSLISHIYLWMELRNKFPEMTDDEKVELVNQISSAIETNQGHSFYFYSGILFEQEKFDEAINSLRIAAKNGVKNASVLIDIYDDLKNRNLKEFKENIRHYLILQLAAWLASYGDSIYSNSNLNDEMIENIYSEYIVYTEEVPLLVYDDTFFSTGRDGFVLFSDGLGYKTFGEDSGFIKLSDINSDTLNVQEGKFIIRNKNQVASFTMANVNKTDFLDGLESMILIIKILFVNYLK